MTYKKKRIPWNKGNRKYVSKCLFCGKKIKSFTPSKYCNRNCYFKSDRMKKLLSDNGKKRKGKSIVAYRISWGYKYIFMPEHPNSTKQGYIAEHRLVAEEKIKRYLLREEVIHHINGVRDDNRPENLLVMSKSEHHKLEAKIQKQKRLKKCAISLKPEMKQSVGNVFK